MGCLLSSCYPFSIHHRTTRVLLYLREVRQQGVQRGGKKQPFHVSLQRSVNTVPEIRPSFALGHLDMLVTFTSMSALALMEILGPVLLDLALAYGVYRASTRKKLTRTENARRDEVTRKLHG